MGVILGALAVLVGAFAQAATGTGLGLISGGILVVVLGRESAITLMSLISFPLMLAILWQNRRATRWTAGLLMSVPALVLTPLLAWLLSWVEEAYLLLAAGVAILTSVYFLYTGRRVASLSGKKGAVVAGTLSSLLNMLSGSGGPPAAIYSVNAGWSPASTRATLQVFFILMSAITIGSLGWPHGDGTTIGILVAAAALGTTIGMLLAKKIPQDKARIAILCLAGLGGLVLFFSGVAELAGYGTL